MNKFTKARIKLYERWAKLLPMMFDNITTRENMLKYHKDNPFVNNEKSRNAIIKHKKEVMRSYEIFIKLENRLFEEGLIKEIA